MKKTLIRFKQLAIRVFNVDATGKTDKEVALAGIEELRAFWNRIGAPSRLSDYGIGEDSLELMADKAVAVREQYGVFKKLDKKILWLYYKPAYKYKDFDKIIVFPGKC